MSSEDVYVFPHCFFGHDNISKISTRAVETRWGQTECSRSSLMVAWRNRLRRWIDLALLLYTLVSDRQIGHSDVEDVSRKSVVRGWFLSLASRQMDGVKGRDCLRLSGMCLQSQVCVCALVCAYRLSHSQSILILFPHFRIIVNRWKWHFLEQLL